MTRPPAPLLLLGLAAGLAACGRPLVDPPEARVEVVAPDLGEALGGTSVQLQLRATGAAALVVGADTLEPDEAGVFSATLRLALGLNRIAVEVLGPGGDAAGVDTLEALRLPADAGLLSTLRLPVARARAAAALLPDGRVAETGGLGEDGQALATATLVEVAGTQVTSSVVPLPGPRVGHTATALEAGVLLLGGATVERPTSAAAFPDAAVLITDSGEALPVAGPALRRAGHATRLLERDGRTLLYVYGGLAASGAGVAPSGTVEIFEWDAAALALTRLTPEGGAGAFDALARPVAVPLRDGPDTATDAVVDGSAALRLTYRAPGSRYPFDVVARTAPALPDARIAAAGARILDGLGLVVGGRDADGGPLATSLVLADGSERIFRLPARLSVPRSDATATRLRDGRLLILGGRPATGTATAAVEVLRF